MRQPLLLFSLAVLTLLQPASTFAGPPRDPASSRTTSEQGIHQAKDSGALRTQIESLQKQIDDLRAEVARRDAALEKQVEDLKPARVSPDLQSARTLHLNDALDRYWGEHRLLMTGNAKVQYHLAGRGEENTFEAEFEPIFLYRVSDRLLFEAALEVELPGDGETEVNLEYGQFDYLLNDAVTVVGGKYLLPFGDFNERIHPVWINKLATTPLLFRHEIGVMPFSDVGVQLRGGLPLGSEDGVDFEYTLFGGNGPRFASADRGAPFEAANNVDVNNNKAAGARLGVRPLPFSWQSGRLKIGASTYHGTWGDSDQGGDLWIHLWGVDSAYQLGEWELRGEYVNMERNLPGAGDEHREGLYLQTSYKLSQLAVPFVDRSELVFRYAQQRQPQFEEEFVRGRQYSLGYDYWLGPTTVWKLEYDYDDRENLPNNHELTTQLAIGF